MSSSRLSCLLVSTLVSGCAAGEPIDPLARALSLAEDAPGAGIKTELVIEVTEEGLPSIADAVWVWDGIADSVPAYCMVHEGLGKCATWFVSVDAQGPVTVFAEVCGGVYSNALALAGVEDRDESLYFDGHVTVQADASACGRDIPAPCGADTDGPALDIATVDRNGDPVDVRRVLVQYNNEPSEPADCLEWSVGQGCSQWGSQRRSVGRYRAAVAYCGVTTTSEWVDVVPDDSGCKPIPEAVELVVDPAACALAP